MFFAIFEFVFKLLGFRHETKPRPPVKAVEDAPWLVRARQDLGVEEIPGPLANERIVGMFDTIGHGEIKSDETAWCAAAIGTWLKESGYPIPPRSRNMGGISYETYGVGLEEPRVGCICVSHYTEPGEEGHGWKRHVGIVTDPGNKWIKVIGGNQGNRVSEQLIAAERITACRWPVAAHPQALLAAGSTEMRAAMNAKEAGLAVGSMSLLGTILNGVMNLSMRETTETLNDFQTLVGVAGGVLRIVAANPWLAGGLATMALMFWIGHTLQANRLAKAKRGEDLSREAAKAAGG